MYVCLALIYAYNALCAVVEVLENMVFLCNASNFVTYFLKSMHYSAAESANMVTNFMGTSFLLTVFGGFICDSYFTRFTTFIFSCVLELLVWIFFFNFSQQRFLRRNFDMEFAYIEQLLTSNEDVNMNAICIGTDLADNPS